MLPIALLAALAGVQTPTGGLLTPAETRPLRENPKRFAPLLKTYPNKDAEAILKAGGVRMNDFPLPELFGKR